MIREKDRSYYIGASDTSYVVGNWTTPTFAKWYGTKQGIYSSNYTNDAMQAGSWIEHNILDALNVKGLQKDTQIILGRLRINLDGNTDTKIYEIKTHRVERPFRVSKNYRQQVCVEMYGTKIMDAVIVAYGLEEKDYRNYYRDIDPDRLTEHPIEYDEKFINEVYVPRLTYLSDCLDKGKFPTIEEFEEKWSGQKSR